MLYRKSRKSLRSKASRTSTKSSKSSKSLKADQVEWLKSRAAPKKVHEPEPLPPRPRKPLDELQGYIEDLAVPKSLHGYLGPREFPVPLKRAVLEYQPTEVITHLASTIPARYKLLPPKPLPPGYVSKGALRYKISERIEKIAEPKPKTVGKESDLREDAFVISPNALKYKATARIQELAKPKERK